MRLLVIGDIHGNLEVLSSTVLQINEEGKTFDLILVTGDIGFDVFPEPREEMKSSANDVYRASISAVFAILRILLKCRPPDSASPSKILFVPGNHDDPAILDKKLYGTALDIDVLQEKAPYHHKPSGFTIWGLGGGPYTDGMKALFPYEWDENDAAIKQRITQLGGGERSIWLSHVPPAGTLLDTSLPMMQRGFGSRELFKRLFKEEKPGFFICGHVHEREYMTPDIICGVPAFNAGALSHQEEIPFLDQYKLPKTGQAMVTRYAIITFAEEEIIVEKFGIISYSGIFLPVIKYIFKSGDLFYEEEKGTLNPLSTTDSIRKKVFGKSGLSHIRI